MTDNIEVSRLRAKFEAETKDFEAGAKKVQSSLGSIAQLARGVGGILAGMIPATLFAGAIQQASEMQDAMAQVNQRLISTKGIAGVTADAVRDLADTAQMMTRFSDDQVVSIEALLLSYTKIGKTVFPRATEAALDMATAMKTDAAGAAKQLGIWLNSPVQAITRLTRAGIVLTAKQQQQIRYFAQTNQLAKAQGIILDELAIRFGGSAVAAGQTFAGQIDRLRHSFENVIEVVGTALLPILQSFLDFGIRLVSGIQQIDPGLVSLAAALGLVAVAAGPIGAILSGILSPIGLLVGAVAGIKVAFDTNLGGIADFIRGIAGQIGPALADVGQALQDAFGMLFGEDPFAAAPATIASDYAAYQNRVAGMIKGRSARDKKNMEIPGFVPPSAGGGSTLGDRLKLMITSAIPKIQEGVAELGAALVKGLNISPEVQSAITTFFSPLTDALTRLKDINWGNVALVGVGIGIVAGGVKGLGLAFGLFKDMLILDALVNALKNISEGVDALKVGDVGGALKSFAVGVGLLGVALAIGKIGSLGSVVDSLLKAVGIGGLSALASGLWAIAGPIGVIALAAAGFALAVDALNKIKAPPPSPTITQRTTTALQTGNMAPVTVGLAQGPAVIGLEGQKEQTVRFEMEQGAQKILGDLLASGVPMNEALRALNERGVIPSTVLEQIINAGLLPNTTLTELVNLGLMPSDVLAQFKTQGIPPDASFLNAMLHGIPVNWGTPPTGVTPPSRDIGGKVNPGEMYRIGVPELLRTGGQTYLLAPQSGYISPIAQSTGRGGGGNTTVNISVNAMDTLSSINEQLRRAGLPTLQVLAQRMARA